MSGRVVADVTGDRELIRDLLKLGDAGIEMGKEVLGEATLKIAAKARPLTPVDDIDGGDLRDSIRVTKPQKTAAGRISAGIVAGGAPLTRLVSEKGHKQPGAYALIVHEDSTMRHPNGGQAKFIEQPYLEEAPKVPDALLARLDKVTHG
jgi:hypothetical protein